MNQGVFCIFPLEHFNLSCVLILQRVIGQCNKYVSLLSF